MTKAGKSIERENRVISNNSVANKGIIGCLYGHHVQEMKKTRLKEAEQLPCRYTVRKRQSGTQAVCSPVTQRSVILPQEEEKGEKQMCGRL